MAAHPRVRGRHGPRPDRARVCSSTPVCEPISPNPSMRACIPRHCSPQRPPIGANPCPRPARSSMPTTRSRRSSIRPASVVAFASPLATDAFLTPASSTTVRRGSGSSKPWAPSVALPVRVLVIPRAQDGSFVVVARTLDDRDEALARLAVQLLIGGAAALAVSTALGWALAGRRPASGRAHASGGRRDLGLRTGTASLRAHAARRAPQRWPRR